MIPRLYTQQQLCDGQTDIPTNRVTYSVAFIGPKRPYANNVTVGQKLTCSFKISLK